MPTFRRQKENDREASVRRKEISVLRIENLTVFRKPAEKTDDLTADQINKQGTIWKPWIIERSVNPTTYKVTQN
jgi:hypothetical protein